MAPVTGRFERRIAVVTGAGQGIGRATATRLASEGARVVAVDRVPDGVKRLADELTARGAACDPLVADVGSYDGAREVEEQVRVLAGRTDVLVNNVGGTRWVKPFVEYSPQEIEEEVARSLWPTIWCCRVFVPGMVERAGGAVVNIGSNSPRGILRVPYATSKGGVFALTTSLAAEVAETGVRVNCVAPGGTEVHDRIVPRNPSSLSDREREWRSEMDRYVRLQIPMRRRGTVEEQAAAVAFLASDDASFITGQILSVAGGACVP